MVKHGDIVKSKKQAFFHWHTIRNEFLKRFESKGIKTSFGFSSFEKVDLTREEVQAFIPFLKEQGFVKYEDPHEHVLNNRTTHSMRYVRVLQSDTRRLNYDVVFHIEKVSNKDFYTVGIAFKRYYPRSHYRTLKAKHEYLMFMW